MSRSFSSGAWRSRPSLAPMTPARRPFEPQPPARRSAWPSRCRPGRCRRPEVDRDWIAHWAAACRSSPASATASRSDFTVATNATPRLRRRRRHGRRRPAAATGHRQCQASRRRCPRLSWATAAPWCSSESPSECRPHTGRSRGAPSGLSAGVTSYTLKVGRAYPAGLPGAPKGEAVDQPDKLDIPQGTLDLMILTILAREPHARLRHLAAARRRSATTTSRSIPGRCFPSLYRLEQDGKLKAEWRPPARTTARPSTTGSRPSGRRSSSSIGSAGTASRLPSPACWRAHDAPASARLGAALDPSIETAPSSASTTSSRHSSTWQRPRRCATALPPAEARRLALLELGGVEQAKERVRTYRHGAWLDEVGRDVRYAFRMFVRNPGFTVIIVLTLALGHRREHGDLQPDRRADAALAAGAESAGAGAAHAPGPRDAGPGGEHASPIAIVRALAEQQRDLRRRRRLQRLHASTSALRVPSPACMARWSPAASSRRSA